ncbi:SCO family protein [Deinococcus koreensis]|uniref:SCO family protein n=1 Tax=Deinococcus koreensis TaxID=2054903 RepID=A0A2K3UZ45_9DEIO|nr:SCO family protein [Deinococcus koreensis]PNY81785.1 SCO family protein [Deinococcus koreensis]
MKWITAVLLAVAAVLGGVLLFRQSSPAVTGGDALDAPRPLPAVALVTDRGAPTTLAASDGRMRLVFYGFVRCPDVCPATLASLKSTYAKLTPQQRERLQVQFITVDPERDRPEVVRAYLNRFDPAFSGLTGTSVAVNEAARAMFVGIVNDTGLNPEHGGHTDGAPASAEAKEAPVGAAEAAIIHGDQVGVVDARGRFVRVYGNGAVIDGTLERDLPGLIRQYGS